MTLGMRYKCKPTAGVEIAQIFSGNGATVAPTLILLGQREIYRAFVASKPDTNPMRASKRK